MPAPRPESELFGRVPQPPGRRRTVVARAWISRKIRGGVFWSHVSLGDGRTRSLSTGTRNRPEALEFCRAQLQSALAAKPAAANRRRRPEPCHHHELRLFG